jgi:hypothetical protein
VQGTGWWMGTKTLILLLSGVLLVGCSGGGPAAGPASTHEADQKKAGAQEGAPEGVEKKEQTRQVELTPEQAARIGIVTTAVPSARYAGTAEGFGAILSHDVVAQAAAELHTSSAASRLSDAALGRAKRLAGTPGALGADAVENAERQQAADQSAVQLARRKLTSLLGVAFPFHEGADSELEKLADGTHKLARVTFPVDAAIIGVPTTLRVSSIDAAAGTAWNAHTVWAAPQDPTLPGRSLFAILTDSTVAEGARVRAQAQSDAAIAGVVVPEPAVVVADGLYWCYVKKNEDAYRRVAIDTGRPLGEGYFVADGIASGEEVVTAGAGSLLARELNASTEPED